MARVRATVESKPEQKQLVCILHDEIYDLAKDIECGIDDCSFSGLKEFLLERTSEIKSKAGQAKKMGIAMENRMRKYRSAIESLGFTRK